MNRNIDVMTFFANEPSRRTRMGRIGVSKWNFLQNKKSFVRYKVFGSSCDELLKKLLCLYQPLYFFLKFRLFKLKKYRTKNHTTSSFFSYFFLKPGTGRHVLTRLIKCVNENGGARAGVMAASSTGLCGGNNVFNSCGH